MWINPPTTKPRAFATVLGVLLTMGSFYFGWQGIEERLAEEKAFQKELAPLQERASALVKTPLGADVGQLPKGTAEALACLASSGGSVATAAACMASIKPETPAERRAREKHLEEARAAANQIESKSNAHQHRTELLDDIMRWKVGLSAAGAVLGITISLFFGAAWFREEEEAAKKAAAQA
jgi:hypothetical protein